jgi:hypothetical protein
MTAQAFTRQFPGNKLSASGYGINSREQIASGIQLMDEARASGAERLFDDSGSRFQAEKEDFRPRRGLDKPPGHFESVQFRQPDIQENDVGLKLFR